MTELLLHPAVVALAWTGGAVLLATGLVVGARVRHDPGGPVAGIRRMIVLMRGFGMCVVGVLFLSVAAGYVLDVRWLITFGLIFGLEELYEATMVTLLLRKAERDYSGSR